MDAVKTLIPNEEQRMRILRVLEDHMVIEIKGGGIWLKAAANLSVCKDQGGCAVIYNEQRKQEERDNLELRNLKISRREAHWAIALAIISICASQFWGHTIFEWTWIAMQKSVNYFLICLDSIFYTEHCLIQYKYHLSIQY